MSTHNAVRLNTGKAADVTITSAVETGDIFVADGFAGINPRDAESGDTVAMNIEVAQFDVLLPASLSLTKGDSIWLNTADVTGHIPNDTAWGTSDGGAGWILYGRALTDQNSTTGQVNVLQLSGYGL